MKMPNISWRGAGEIKGFSALSFDNVFGVHAVWCAFAARPLNIVLARSLHNPVKF
jgi:hypothetical protein